MKGHKAIYISSLLFVLLLAGILLLQAGFIGYFKKTNESNTVVRSNDTADQQSNKVTVQYASEPMTYEDALLQYRDWRIQIFNCVSTPTFSTIKNGKSIMLDNRSPDPHEITIDGRAYRLGGYDFVIVSLKAVRPPHTLQVDCQSGSEIAKNIAPILIQQ